MSIEALLQAQIDALKENTAAVNALAKSLYGRALGGDNDTPVIKVADKPKAEAKPEVKEEPSKEERLQAAIEEAAEVTKQLQTEREAATATSYETLRELVLKLASGGKREEIKAVSKTHGLGAPKDLLDPKDGVTVLDQAKLEALYADLLALEA